MIIGRLCFVTIHVTFRFRLSASWTKEHFAELFFEQTNISTNARPVRDTSVQFAFRSRNVVKRQGLIIYHILNWQECFTASYYSVYITNATIMNLTLLWVKRPSDKLRCKFRWEELKDVTPLFRVCEWNYPGEICWSMSNLVYVRSKDLHLSLQVCTNKL